MYYPSGNVSTEQYIRFHAQVHTYPLARQSARLVLWGMCFVPSLNLAICTHILYIVPMNKAIVVFKVVGESIYRNHGFCADGGALSSVGAGL